MRKTGGEPLDIENRMRPPADLIIDRVLETMLQGRKGLDKKIKLNNK